MYLIHTHTDIYIYILNLAEPEDARTWYSNPFGAPSQIIHPFGVHPQPFGSWVEDEGWMDGLVEEYFSNTFAMSGFDDILVLLRLVLMIS